MIEVVRHAGSSVAHGGTETEGVVILGLEPCDVKYVNVPDFPELPGGRRNVLGIHRSPCPCHHPEQHAGVHYVLEGPVAVCECPLTSQFYWYTRK